MKGIIKKRFQNFTFLELSFFLRYHLLFEELDTWNTHTHRMFGLVFQPTMQKFHVFFAQRYQSNQKIWFRLWTNVDDKSVVQSFSPTLLWENPMCSLQPLFQMDESTRSSKVDLFREESKCCEYYVKHLEFVLGSIALNNIFDNALPLKTFSSDFKSSVWVALVESCF